MKKKRRYFIVFCLGLLLILGTIVSYKYINIYFINNQINADGFKLLGKEHDYKNVLSIDYLQIGGFGCKSYSNEEKGIEIGFSGFPDVRNNYVLTSITVSNYYSTILGLRVGDDITQASQILNRSGFVAIQNDSRLIYKRNRVFMRLFTDEKQKINKISISLHSTNIFNIIF